MDVHALGATRWSVDEAKCIPLLRSPLGEGLEEIDVLVAYHCLVLLFLISLYYQLTPYVLSFYIKLADVWRASSAREE